MRVDYTYDVHKSVEAHRIRHLERQLSHRRALKSTERSGGLISWMTDGLTRLRSLAKRQSGILYDQQLLSDEVCRITDQACRLTDGSAGRLAVCYSGTDRVQVCVPAHSGR